MKKMKYILGGVGSILIGIPLILTGIDSFRQHEMEPGGLIFMVICAGIFFAFGIWLLLQVQAISAEENRKETEKFKRNFVADYDSDTEDHTPLEKMLTAFREEWKEFFGGGTLIDHVTQIFWHVSKLQKKRLEQKGMRLQAESKRQKYGSESPVKMVEVKGLHFNVYNVSEDISSDRIYLKKSTGEKLFTLKDREIAHYTLLEAEKAQDGNIICPSCGAEGTRKSLIDGCDYCDTKFTVNDLSQRVASYSLRRDANTLYSKYRGGVTRFSKMVLAAAMVLTFVLTCLVYLFMGAELVAENGLGMAICISILAAAFLAVCVGVLCYTVILPVFAFLQGIGLIGLYGAIVTDPTKKQAEKDRNMQAYVRRSDAAFDISVFYNNVQNKIASVVFAETKEDTNVFADAGVDLGLLHTKFADVIDMDIVTASLEYYTVDTVKHLQRAGVDLKLRLVVFNGKKPKVKIKTVRMNLCKDLACMTPEVFAPSVMKCSGCGSSVSVIESKQCPSCGTVIDLKKYDWAITGIR